MDDESRLQERNTRRGAAPVATLDTLSSVEAQAVRGLRRWCEGTEGRAALTAELTRQLGEAPGQHAVAALDGICGVFVRHGRRALMRHCLDCLCVGADEACFATFVATAAEGPREDAMLMAMLLVRPDAAPQLVSLAQDFGLALLLMERLGGTRSPTLH